MKVEQTRQGVYRLTVHALELAALISAARWVAEGRDGEVPDEARTQLEDLLGSYDRQLDQLRDAPQVDSRTTTSPWRAPFRTS